MHIVFLSHEYPFWSPGGVGTFIQILGRALVEEGHQVKVLGPGKDLKEVTFSYSKTGPKVLNNFELSIPVNSSLGLVGTSGAGKSTLIKIISGVYHQDDGEMSYNGTNLKISNPKYARNLGIETIYQDLALADNLNVGANIFLGREPLLNLFGPVNILDREKMMSESRQILESLDIEIPEFSLNQPVRRLSGGQRQAIAICRAIYWKAELLIMDEPTAALGVPEQRKVMQLIRRLREQNIAIIFISHNLIDIFEIADRIVILRQGRLVGDRMINGINKEEVVSLMVQGKLTVN